MMMMSLVEAVLETGSDRLQLSQDLIEIRLRIDGRAGGRVISFDAAALILGRS